MGSRILFAGFPDYLEPQFEDVVITGSADAGFPVSRLRERALYRKARLTATGEWIISWHYGGETREISAIGAFDHNFPVDATVQPVLYNTTDFVAGVTEPWYDGGVRPALEPWDTEFSSVETPDWGDFEWGGVSPEERVLALPRNFIHPILKSIGASKLPTEPRHISCKGGALIIRGLSTAPSAFASIGMLMTAKLWQPSRNFKWNWKIKLRAIGDAPTQGRDGRNWGRNYGALREMELQLDLLDRSEIVDFAFPFGFDRGWASPLLVIPEPDRPEYWWALAGLFNFKPGALPGMSPRPAATDLWDLEKFDLVEWK
jgi:hypothetical protein